MKLKLFVYLSLSFLSLSISVIGQEAEKENTFTLSGQLRTRFEYRDGAFTPLSKKEDPAVLILNRARLNLDYQYLDKLEMRLSLQNVNLWGQANPMQVMDKGGNSIAPFEAWAGIKVYKNLKVKVGRQTISLDDGRLFSDVDWANSGRAHDALKVNFQKGKFEGDLWLAFNQNYESLYGNNVNNPSGNLYNNKDAQPYKTMQTLWAKYRLEDHSYISFLLSNIGFQNAGSSNDQGEIFYLQTMGLYYSFDYPNVFGSVSGYYQTGASPAYKKSNAFLLAAAIGAPLNDRFRISIGSDYVSGNVPGTPSGKNKAFQHLYGTGHKFYGNMDYYYAGNAFGDGGLIDNQLKIQYVASSRMKINVEGHLFFSAAKIPVPDKPDGRGLGQEADAMMAFKINKFVDLNLGYSLYFTTPVLLSLKETPDAQSIPGWGWVSLNVHPEFFKLRF